MIRVIVRIVLASAISIGVGVALLAGFGATRDRDHVAARTVTLERPTDEVFAILDDVAAYPCWRTNVSAVDTPSDDRYIEHAGDEQLAFVVEERSAPARRVVRIDGDDRSWGGSWTYELTPTETGGTTLTITERGFVDPVLLRAIAAVVIDPSASIAQFQDDLRRYHGCRPTSSAPGGDGVTPP